MNNIATWTTAFLTALVIAACGPGSDNYEERTVPEETEILQGTDLSEGTREAFQSTADQELDFLQQELDALKGRLDAHGAESELTAEIEQWEQEYQQLQQKLDSAGAVAESGWEQFQSEVIVALDELRRSLDDMTSRVSASLD
jgi:hypothetical protein